MSNKPKGVSIHPCNMLLYKYNLTWICYMNFTRMYGHNARLSSTLYEFIDAIEHSIIHKWELSSRINKTSKIRKK
jgi:hypothetical protein